jgi:hypothetical protein
MTATKDSMLSFPEDILAMLLALKSSGIRIDLNNILDQKNKQETKQEEFERLIQTRDAIEYQLFV